jgi:hypothetical protein
MEIHLKMFQWIVAFGAEWRKELPCKCRLWYFEFFFNVFKTHSFLFSQKNN